jgi:putative ABC transport system permease protein
VLLAVLALFLLRRRGIAGERGFDPYLAAVPLLLALAVGLVALRLYPFPMRVLANGTAKRRDLVPSLGFRRVSRQPVVTTAPLLVVLVSVSVALFAAVVAASLDSAQHKGSGALSPLATGTVDAYRVVIGAASVYAALGLLLIPLLTARARLRDLVYLRALGLSGGQAITLTALELAPPMLAAIGLGAAVGVADAFLIEPGLDLAALGGTSTVPLGIPVVVPGLLAVCLVLVLAAAVAATAATEQKLNLGRVLRTGER